MKNAGSVWESSYLDAYDKILLNSDIYLAVRDFHVKAMADSHKVLDSGCGTGNVAIELLKKGHVVYAVDNSEKALGMLRKKCPQYADSLHVYKEDAGKLPFGNGMFDGITSMFVVYYLDRPEDCIKENYRVLKEDGVLALTGRASAENMEKVLRSYEESLRKRRLLEEVAPEFSIFKKKFMKGVTKAAANCQTYEEMKGMLQSTGFRNIRQFPNPYFGQCYSLVARK
jgi:ubiquinone/menaquinone biosynthesis C-methylase UbiE